MLSQLGFCGLMGATDLRAIQLALLLCLLLLPFCNLAFPGLFLFLCNIYFPPEAPAMLASYFGKMAFNRTRTIPFNSVPAGTTCLNEVTSVSDGMTFSSEDAS